MAGNGYKTKGQKPVLRASYKNYRYIQISTFNTTPNFLIKSKLWCKTLASKRRDLGHRTVEISSLHGGMKL